MKAKLIISGSIHKPSVSGNQNTDLITPRRSPFYYFSLQFFPRCQIKRETEATGLEWGIWLNPPPKLLAPPWQNLPFRKHNSGLAGREPRDALRLQVSTTSPGAQAHLFPSCWRGEAWNNKPPGEKGWGREGGEGMSHLANREGLGWANSHLWD